MWRGEKENLETHYAKETTGMIKKLFLESHIAVEM